MTRDKAHFQNCRRPFSEGPRPFPEDARLLWCRACRTQPSQLIASMPTLTARHACATDEGMTARVRLSRLIPN